MSHLWPILILMQTSCTHLFFQPDAYLYEDPTKNHPHFEEFTIPSTNQVKLRAWHLPCQQNSSRGLVIHFHGNAQNMSAHQVFSEWLAKHGYDVLLFDYRGYGASSGDPSQVGLVEDGKAVLQFARDSQKFKSLPKIILGQSLGGAIALSALKEAQTDAQVVILDSTFSSYQEVAQSILASQWATWPFQWLAPLLVTDHASPLDALGGIQKVKSWLVIHSKNDPVVPFSNSRPLVSFLSERHLTTWDLTHPGHITAFAKGSPYRQKILDFLCENLYEHPKMACS